MDSMHDLGGMHGFGRIVPEPHEPVFHAPWEGRRFALTSAVPFAVPYCDDQFRPAIERMEPSHYLKSSYYEKWYEAVVRLLQERRVISAAELDGSAPPAQSHALAVRADAVLPAIFAGASQARPEAKVARRFSPGDRVRTRATMGAGHNRLPRYARGKVGVVDSVHAPFLVADRNSIDDQTPETLYTVRFEASTLWGTQAPPGDTLSLDLWDSYLEHST